MKKQIGQNYRRNFAKRISDIEGGFVCTACGQRGADFGVTLGGWLGYLIAGFVGACILIFAWRAIKGRT